MVRFLFFHSYEGIFPFLAPLTVVPEKTFMYKKEKNFWFLSSMDSYDIAFDIKLSIDSIEFCFVVRVEKMMLTSTLAL